MSTTKKCKRCIYDKVIYKVDYEFSARRQLIFYYEIKICSKCNHYSRDSYNLKRAELDNYPSCLNVDLSKIVHEHNHNKLGRVEEFPRYNEYGYCIELFSINHYKCDFCDKESDYIEKNKYDLNNPCDRMNELTSMRKSEEENWKMKRERQKEKWKNEMEIEAMKIETERMKKEREIEAMKKIMIENPNEIKEIKDYIEKNITYNNCKQFHKNIGICYPTGKKFEKIHKKLYPRNRYHPDIYGFVCSECGIILERCD